ncbi:MAG: endo-1,4-beta-xylanase [Sideroxydans sp.]|nr:endo-1,4-beta-xylanase [Sideroxydans sp.]
MNRRKFLLLSSLAWAGLAFRGNGIAEAQQISKRSLTLRDIARGSGYDIGCAMTTSRFEDKLFMEAVRRECSCIVAEYQSKRHVLEPSRGMFDFEGMDRLVAFAHKNKMKFRGHTLVWHAANPAWLVAELNDVPKEGGLTEYIAKVVGRYRGRVHSWDVVNEAINPADGRSDGLRESIWLKAFGTSYIDMAFHAAHEADPNASLVYNDYNTEGVWKYGDAWRSSTIEMLAGMKARGVPIHAYGMQAHLDPNDRPIDPKVLANFLQEIKDLGLRIQVTELDVRDFKLGRSVEEKNRIAAETTKLFLDVVLSLSVTDEILTWGLSDKYSWLNDSKNAPFYGGIPSPLPLDWKMVRKPMWYAIAKSIAVKTK